LKDFQSVILNDVDVLWYAESALEFNTLSTKILMDWRTSFPDFAEYFEKQWMRKHKPSEWASFGRPRDAPSGIASAFIYCIVGLTFMQKGSGSVEGLNHRLQGMVKERTRAGLEAFVHELKKEADFFDKVITNEQVFSERKKTHDTNVRKHLKKKKTKLQQITSSHRARSHHSGITYDKDTTAATTTSTSSSITSTTIATSPIPFQLTDSLEDPLYDDLFSDKTSSDTEDDDIADLILLQPVLSPVTSTASKKSSCSCGSEYVHIYFHVFIY
jgi:hypothetical protein